MWGTPSAHQGTAASAFQKLEIGNPHDAIPCVGHAASGGLTQQLLEWEISRLPTQWP